MFSGSVLAGHCLDVPVFFWHITHVEVQFPVSGGYLLVLPCLVILKTYFLIVSSSSNQHHELSQTNQLGTQRCCDAESRQ